MSEKLINYQQFLERYKAGEITVLVNKSKAGDFVMSKFSDKHNKPAHLFWTWLGILLIFPTPVIFWILFGWVHALGSFVVGLMISAAARKSASQFVLQNMLESEDFWDWVLLHKGATILDEEENEIKPKFTKKIDKEYGTSSDVRETEQLAHRQVRKIEELVHKYGKIQENVSKQMLKKYPAMVFPVSLLPAPKDEVQKALNEAIGAIKYTDYTEDEKRKMIENLNGCLVFLNNFIDDKEANRRNNEYYRIRNGKRLLNKNLIERGE